MDTEKVELTKKELWERAWRAVDPGPGVIDVHKANLKTKRVMEARRKARAIAGITIAHIQKRVHIKANRQLVLDELIAELSLNWIGGRPFKAKAGEFRIRAKKKVKLSKKQRKINEARARFNLGR